MPGFPEEEPMTIRSTNTETDPLHARATRKVMLRLLPVMFAVYFMSYIDRTNVALAKTHLAADVGIGAAAFGFGAGVFFISYAFLEIPSNLLMYRVGPRRWIARIAVTWGALSAVMMFVQGPVSFYVLRFLLGAAEAGLYPALMYMVTLWFAQRHRATVIGLIYLAPTTALIVGSPLGGGLMELDDLLGLHGWQWMFLIEGLVTVLVGVLVWFKLPSVPSEAPWLTREEAAVLTERAGGGDTHTETRIRGNVKKAFGRPFVVVVALIYFFNQITNVGIVFNIPSIVESLGIEGSFLIGLVSGSAGIGATIGVLLVPRIFRNHPHREAAAVGLLGPADPAHHDLDDLRVRHAAPVLVDRDGPHVRPDGRRRPRIHQHRRSDRRLRRPVPVRHRRGRDRQPVGRLLRRHRLVGRRRAARAGAGPRHPLRGRADHPGRQVRPRPRGVTATAVTAATTESKETP
jgi:MFS family permease